MSGQTAVGLAAAPASARVARRFVAEHLDGRGCAPGQVEVAVLLTSELVTNAILHAEGTIELRITAGHRGIVRIEVEDASGGRVPRKRSYPNDAATGRGLALVETLGTSWGVERGGMGKTVWVEIAPSS